MAPTRQQPSNDRGICACIDPQSRYDAIVKPDNSSRELYPSAKALTCLAILLGVLSPPRAFAQEGSLDASLKTGAQSSAETASSAPSTEEGVTSNDSANDAQEAQEVEPAVAEKDTTKNSDDAAEAVVSAEESPTEEAEPLPACIEEEVPVPQDLIYAAGYGNSGQNRISVGALYDALAPEAVYGAYVRFPQFDMNARFGLGDGWSIVSRLNTAFVVSELTVGASYAFPIVGNLRGLAQFQTGVFFGMLGQFGFSTWQIAPEFRPLLGLSLPIDNGITFSLRGEIIFSGLTYATVGDVSTNLATTEAVSNWNIMFMMEKQMENKHAWYAGLGLMSSVAAYQLWVIYPDNQNYDSYLRLVAGYEF